jgi:hypothetical protein
MEPCLDERVWYKRAGVKRVSLGWVVPSQGAYPYGRWGRVNDNWGQ